MQEIFIAKAKAKYGKKYDYSKVKYVRSPVKVTIICPLHGEFRQSPNNHLSSKSNGGCRACANEKLRTERCLNLDEVVQRFKAIHSDKYDYSKFTYYHNSNGKITIGCKKHGDYQQRIRAHLSGAGCAKCHLEKAGDAHISNTEEFVSKALQVHKGLYAYSKVNYIKSWIKVKITCKEHGDYEQVPNAHLRGQGCPLCARVKIGEALRSNTLDFINKANKIHNNKYDYSKTKYVSARIKVTIICPVHGEFRQDPNNHLNGDGCLRCSESKGETTIARILQARNIVFHREYKIPKNRYRYDFYLPDYNLLIEFHGAQHYRSVDFFGGVDGYRRRVFLDSVKEQLARVWKYRYLCIPHTVFDNCSEEEFESRLLNAIKLGLN